MFLSHMIDANDNFLLFTLIRWSLMIFSVVRYTDMKGLLIALVVLSLLECGIMTTRFSFKRYDGETWLVWLFVSLLWLGIMILWFVPYTNSVFLMAMSVVHCNYVKRNNDTSGCSFHWYDSDPFLLSLIFASI